ncbi:alpha/beta hydrolase [Nocardia huaxiensis]|uniref:Alpha/beta hydrolase n=1 Tax=Nocardia huaxiensis TaxID=2755382 RepID=A0A7D6ZLE1_9NOCA|nr:alpha/beta hydrolase [Nocardia huaxiensis]QLY28445.1 alpha/beta hydrolase [Nocardia huaxiensis]UFS98105.1 alpha/beta hydrolase [Nocardia huaxiensis]
MAEPPHTHLFRPGTGTTTPPFVLLHGSDGTESDLLPFADALAPDASTLAVRGAVALPGGYAFFHRFPDRRLDETDIAARAPRLASFIETSCAAHNLAQRPIAIGFSNGAIMAAALLMTRPSLLSGAILLRPLSPFTDDPAFRLDGTPVLIIDGEKDSRRSPGDGLRLAERLRPAGALLTHHVLPGGHSITDGDRDIAREWPAGTRF